MRRTGTSIHAMRWSSGVSHYEEDWRSHTPRLLNGGR